MLNSHTITVKVERFTNVVPEWRKCLHGQWIENGKFHDAVPLDPDVERYLTLDVANMLSMVVARDPDGYFVGYLLALVNHHLHHKGTLFAQIDAFWLKPRFRRGTNGLRLFTMFQAEAQRLGVSQIIGHSAQGTGPDSSAIYKALGWSQVETIFMKAVN